MAAAGRTLTRIEALVGGTPVFIATTHLEPGGAFGCRAGQMRELQEKMQEATAPNCFVAGACRAPAPSLAWRQ